MALMPGWDNTAPYDDPYATRNDLRGEIVQLRREVERLRVEARNEAAFIHSLTNGGSPIETGWPELTAALDRMEAGWRD